MTVQFGDGGRGKSGVAAPLLEIQDLSVQFSLAHTTVRAVSRVSLSVSRGECVGVVGESGSGKSVTFAAAIGLVSKPGRVTGGQVHFDGRDVLSMSARSLREVRGGKIAVVMQDALSALNPALTIGRQISETLRAHHQAPNSRERKKRALALLDLVRIPNAARVLQLYPHELSGGMRQRAMIAIALACNPALLIADEPTTALDVTIQAQVMELLAALRSEIGMTMVLITHDLGIVSERCDRVYVMYAGQIMESGPTDQVLAAPGHPYTQGLLRAMPRLETRHRSIVPIPGQVPDLSQPLLGCPFFERCTYADAQCRGDIPLQERGAGRQVRCVRPLRSE